MRKQRTSGCVREGVLGNRHSYRDRGYTRHGLRRIAWMLPFIDCLIVCEIILRELKKPVVALNGSQIAQLVERR